MNTRVEMCLIKNELRRAGLPTRGVYFQEFARLGFEQEKKWHRIREKAKARAAELADRFPFAMGAYRHELLAQQIAGRVGAC